MMKMMRKKNKYEVKIMKIIICFLVVLLMLNTAVLAQGQGINEPGTGREDPEIREAGQGTGQGLAQDRGNDTGAQAQEAAAVMAQQRLQAREEAKEENRNRLQQGLTNALTHVQNENARQRIQQNIESFQERVQERLHKFEDIEITEVDNETGATKIRAREEVRFFGFIKAKATKRFEIDSEGNMVEKHPWYRFMYRETPNTE